MAAVPGDDQLPVARECRDGRVIPPMLLCESLPIGPFFFRYPTVDRWVEGEPMVLVEDGKPVASHLAQERITHAELGAAVRRQGLVDLGQVQRATLENSGEITIIKRDDDPLLRRLERIEQLLREQRQAPGHGGVVEA